MEVNTYIIEPIYVNSLFYQQVSMQPEYTESKSISIHSISTQSKFQIFQKFQPSVLSPEDQQIKRKVELQLYLHFERALSKSAYHYEEPSIYQGKQVSKQKIVDETIKYLNCFEENLQNLQPQHNQQLLFLIENFKEDNKLITCQYYIHSDDKDQPGPAKFYLGFYEISQRIDFMQFVSFENWNHIIQLSIYHCEWFGDDDWRALIEHADNFKYLKDFWFAWNKISTIKEGDIEEFKSLKYISLCKLLIKTIDDDNLSRQSKEVLRRLRQKNNQIKVDFNE